MQRLVLNQQLLPHSPKYTHTHPKYECYKTCILCYNSLLFRCECVLNFILSKHCSSVRFFFVGALVFGTRSHNICIHDECSEGSLFVLALTVVYVRVRICIKFHSWYMVQLLNSDGKFTQSEYRIYCIPSLFNVHKYVYIIGLDPWR